MSPTIGMADKRSVIFWSGKMVMLVGGGAFLMAVTVALDIISMSMFLLTS